MNYRVKSQILVPETSLYLLVLCKHAFSSATCHCSGSLPVHLQISQGRNCSLFVLTLDIILWTYYNFLFVLFETGLVV